MAVSLKHFQNNITIEVMSTTGTASHSYTLANLTVGRNFYDAYPLKFEETTNNGTRYAFIFITLEK